MATTNPMVDTSTASENPNGSLLVLLPSSPQAQLETILTHLTASFPAEDLLIASPEAPPDSHLNLRFVDLPASKPSWTLTAGDFVSASQLAQKNNVRAILILGPESSSLPASSMGGLANAVLTDAVDLAVPCYDLQARAGLVNSSIL